jgi:succinate dehydrogenase subunit C
MLTRPMSPVWYLRSRAYVVFMLRELTSVFNALYMVFLLILLYSLSQGPEACAAFLAFLGAPGMIVLHLVALGFSVLHTVTWFNATGKAIVIRRGEERLPDAALVAPNYAAWVLVSTFVLWIVLRG